MGQTQLLLGTPKPHSVVKKSTVSGWIRSVLTVSVIDACLIKAHSTRSEIGLPSQPCNNMTTYLCIIIPASFKEAKV